MLMYNLMLVHGNLVHAESDHFLDQAIKLGDFIDSSGLFLPSLKPGLLGQLLLPELLPEWARLWKDIHLVIELVNAGKTLLLVPV